ncbi:MAG: hypothetical protein ACOYMA_12300 [Bacteroidia bacterium]
MADFVKYGTIISLDKDFIEKVKAYEPPKFIGKVKIKGKMEISIQHILMSWNIKEDSQLLPITAKAYGLNPDKIDKYPLIDFIRLTIELQEISEKAAKMFMELKRENKDSELQSVLEGFSTSDLGLIDRFVKRCGGAYTHDTASDVSWYIVYTAFKEDTDEYDKQLAISEIMEKRNGNK